MEDRIGILPTGNHPNESAAAVTATTTNRAATATTTPAKDSVEAPNDKFNDKKIHSLNEKMTNPSTSEREKFDNMKEKHILLIRSEDSTVNDVLLGRGKGATEWIGNRKYYEILKSMIPEYAQCASKGAKKKVTIAVVKKVQRGGGRFLRYVNPDVALELRCPQAIGKFQLVPDETARVKVGQALRHAMRNTSKDYSSRQNKTTPTNGTPASEEKNQVEEKKTVSRERNHSGEIPNSTVQHASSQRVGFQRSSSSEVETQEVFTEDPSNDDSYSNHEGKFANGTILVDKKRPHQQHLEEPQHHDQQKDPPPPPPPPFPPQEQQEKAKTMSSTQKTKRKFCNWNKMYKLLVLYTVEHGHTTPTQSEYYRGHPIGEWCKYLRIKYSHAFLGNGAKKRSNLMAERIALLNRIGFAWMSPSVGRSIGRLESPNLSLAEQTPAVPKTDDAKARVGATRTNTSMGALKEDCKTSNDDNCKGLSPQLQKGKESEEKKILNATDVNHKSLAKVQHGPLSCEFIWIPDALRRVWSKPRPYTPKRMGCRTCCTCRNQHTSGTNNVATAVKCTTEHSTSLSILGGGKCPPPFNSSKHQNPPAGITKHLSGATREENRQLLDNTILRASNDNGRSMRRKITNSNRRLPSEGAAAQLDKAKALTENSNVSERKICPNCRCGPIKHRLLLDDPKHGQEEEPTSVTRYQSQYPRKVDPHRDNFVHIDQTHTTVQATVKDPYQTLDSHPPLHGKNEHSHPSFCAPSGVFQKEQKNRINEFPDDRKQIERRNKRKIKTLFPTFVTPQEELNSQIQHPRDEHDDDDRNGEIELPRYRKHKNRKNKMKTNTDWFGPSLEGLNVETVERPTKKGKMDNVQTLMELRKTPATPESRGLKNRPGSHQSESTPSEYRIEHCLAEMKCGGDELDAGGSCEQRADDEFTKMCTVLKHFKREHDHVCPSINEVYRGWQLGAWINSLRTPSGIASLSSSQLRQLDELGMVWRMDKCLQRKAAANVEALSKEHQNKCSELAMQPGQFGNSAATKGALCAAKDAQTETSQTTAMPRNGDGHRSRPHEVDSNNKREHGIMQLNGDDADSETETEDGSLDSHTDLAGDRSCVREKANQSTPPPLPEKLKKDFREHQSHIEMIPLPSVPQFKGRDIQQSFPNDLHFLCTCSKAFPLDKKLFENITLDYLRKTLINRPIAGTGVSPLVEGILLHAHKEARKISGNPSTLFRIWKPVIPKRAVVKKTMWESTDFVDVTNMDGIVQLALETAIEKLRKKVYKAII